MMPECPRVGMLWLGPETLREDRPPAARDFNMHHVTKCSQPPSEDVTPNVRMQKLRLRALGRLGQAHELARGGDSEAAPGRGQKPPRSVAAAC